MSGNESVDRRVVRTKRMLREALLELILERGWDEVSVQDVCDRADVGRSTFYTHFGDREDLLLSGFDDLRKWLRAAPADGRPLGFTRGLAEHVHEQRRLFRAVVGKRSGNAVQKRFTKVVLGLVEEDVALLCPAGPERDGAARFLSGALIEMLVGWVDGRSSLSAEALDALFHRLAGPVLAELRGRDELPHR